MPKISVIVPVYKVGEYINRCVDSILNQTFKDFELILVDDGSPDNSPAICDEYAEKDSRIIVIHKENGGVSSARNCGLKKASGEFIAFIDSDDYVEQDYLTNLITNIGENDLAICGVRYCNQDGSVQYNQLNRGDFQVKLNEYYGTEISDLIYDRKLNYVYAKLFRNKIILGNLIKFDEQMSLGEDTFFVFNYLEKADSIFVAGKCCYNYVQNVSDSLTSVFYTDIYDKYLHITEHIEKVLQTKGLYKEIYHVLDYRKLLSGIWAVDKILYNKQLTDKEKCFYINNVLNNEQYKKSYNRYNVQQKRYLLEPIKPQNGKIYLRKVKRKRAILKFKGKLLSLCPTCIKNIYRKHKNAKES